MIKDKAIKIKIKLSKKNKSKHNKTNHVQSRKKTKVTKLKRKIPCMI